MSKAKDHLEMVAMDSRPTRPRTTNSSASFSGRRHADGSICKAASPETCPFNKKAEAAETAITGKERSGSGHSNYDEQQKQEKMWEDAMNDDSFVRELGSYLGKDRIDALRYIMKEEDRDCDETPPGGYDYPKDDTEFLKFCSGVFLTNQAAEPTILRCKTKDDFKKRCAKIIDTEIEFDD